MGALLLQHQTLMHAEPMLLVDHRQAEVGEGHALLNERVGPDHQVDGAVADPFQHPGALLSGDSGGQEGEGDGVLSLGFD